VTDAVLAQLDALGLAYEVVPCDPDLADTANFCEAYGYAPEDSANAIVVIGKSDPPRYVMCLVLSSTRLDVNRVVRKRLGVRRASFASADQTKELTGMEIGGVTPFGIPGDLALWVDARVMDRSEVIIGGGGRDRKLLVPPATLAGHPNVTVIEGLANPVPAE
jgi:prolyl-tRNA editing enzyme YbaK/EbsC (Cys-tRNA(Pro) deacylase)